MEALERITPFTHGLSVLIGFAHQAESLFNACAVLDDGEIVAIYHKHFLPNYSVFDEERYFEPGRELQVFRKHAVVLGVNICEDIWYDDGPSNAQALAGGARLIVNISSSPYHIGKPRAREEMLRSRAMDCGAYFALCNLAGGQDELVFDGHSCVISPGGEVLARAQGFAEDMLIYDVDVDTTKLPPPRKPQSDYARRFAAIETITLSDSELTQITVPPKLTPRREPEEAEVWAALKLGLGDYVRKNGFSDAVLGVSGGVDSALTAAIAADALGADHVHAVIMPTRFTSQQSWEDAWALINSLGIHGLELPIDKLYQLYLDETETVFSDKPRDTTEENLQARIRGNLLMALSNKFGWLVLATGNKSEISTGYCTLYGDMAGGYGVLKDVYKTLVWRLCRWWNQVNGREMIPVRVIDKPPTAELKDNQLDTDSLPSYPVLDGILHAYVEENLRQDEIEALGYDRAVVDKVIRLVDRNEYKRRQAAPGIRITQRGFGKDRRMPLTNGWVQ
jgi:NAD+ synthase (glutamine-hydrolysing)